MRLRRVSILGSTGSIGRQALDVAARHPDRFRISALAAYQSADLLVEQVRAFRPETAGLVCPPEGFTPPADVAFCRFAYGAEALPAAVDTPADDVLDAVVGMAGLESVLRALNAGRRVLLANKEALVAGGELVTRAASAAEKRRGDIAPALLPVDSEHSAIFQCLEAARGSAVHKLLLTCSGGPFRDWQRERMARVTPAQALAHPKWRMGPKITVDSATLFNKALEVIEARWLFGVPPERIEVLIHPQSVVHSLVEFADGAVLAQLGAPDMRVPIAYAMAYPERVETGAPRLDLRAQEPLSFGAPDETRFPALRIGRDAMRAGGAACCVMNAANEVAVAAFLAGRIPYPAIADTVAETLQRLGAPPADTLEAVLDADSRARAAANALIGG